MQYITKTLISQSTGYRDGPYICCAEDVISYIHLNLDDSQLLQKFFGLEDDFNYCKILGGLI